MLKTALKISVFISTAALLTGCSGVFDTDNTPAPKPLESIQTAFTPVSLWSTSVGKNTDNWLKQTPALRNNVIYTTSDAGDIYAINAVSGQRIWSTHLKGPFASGPSVSDTTVLIVNRFGHVFALDAATGAVKWQQDTKNEVLASPAISQQIAVVKTTAGDLLSFSSETGHPGWLFHQNEPTFALHGASAPRLSHDYVYAGFANGNFAKLNTRTGQALWIKTLTIPEGAFAIERMIDIDADPTLHGDVVFAASFQGKVAALDTQNGNILWSHALSSYTGMTTDGDTLYITDAKGTLWSFDAHSGKLLFQQSDLLARGLSAPTLAGGYVVVGDKLGYLHWFDKQTGRIVARISLGSAIQATPLVENNRLFVLTQNGQLTAYKL